MLTTHMYAVEPPTAQFTSAITLAFTTGHELISKRQCGDFHMKDNHMLNKKINRFDIQEPQHCYLLFDLNSLACLGVMPILPSVILFSATFIAPT